MNFKIKVGLLFAYLLITGCASSDRPPLELSEQKPYHSNPEFSFAMNVASASGLNYHRLRDAKISQEEYDRVFKPRGSADKGGSTVGGVLFDGAISGLSNTLSLGMKTASVLGMLTSMGQPDAAEAGSYVFGWLDKDGTPMSEIPDYVSDIIKKSVNDYLIQHDFVTKPHLAVGKFKMSGVYIVENPKCTFPYVKSFRSKPCIIGSTQLEQGLYHKARSPHFLGVMESYKPDFLGSGESIFVRGMLYDHVTRFGLIEDYYWFSLDMWKYVTKQLPESFFIYLAPKSYTYENSNGVRQYGRSPIVVHNGVTHLFVVVENEKTAGN